MAAIIKFWYRIVKFKNGEYGIRRWLFGWEYLDLNTSLDEFVWRRRNYTYFYNCQHSMLGTVMGLYEMKLLPPKKTVDYGEPV